MKNINKVLKYIGNILMVVALIFIFRKLLTFDIDYSVIFEPNNLIILVIVAILFSFTVFVTCVPWKNLLEMITGKKFKFNEVTLVFCKANIMKYIPGNVFQYVGRNEFALGNDISHSDVGFATILEIINTILGIILCSLIFNAKGLFYWIANYGNQYKYMIVILLIVIILVIIAFIFLKDKIKAFIGKLVKLINKKNVKVIIFNIVFSVVQNIITSILFLIILKYVVGGEVTYSNIPIIIGAFLISWLVGFLTIGSPGGIGVRELVMCLLLEGIMPEDVILLSIVVFRFITILGDLLAVVLAKSFNKYQKRNIAFKNDMPDITE